MVKVLLVSRNESDNTLILKKLTPLRKEFGSMQFNTARPANLTQVLDIDTTLMVFNSNVYTSSLREMTHHLRSVGYLGPMMITTKVPDPRVLGEFQNVQNVVILEKPYTQKDLLGVARKFLIDRNVKQRRFRRFDTKQMAHLESYQRDLVLKTKVKNISRGGLYIKGELKDMAKGDLLRVNLDLDKINKSYTMSAKVVWTEGDVGARERAAGLQFMSKEAVYNHLLNVI